MNPTDGLFDPTANVTSSEEIRAAREENERTHTLQPEVPAKIPACYRDPIAEHMKKLDEKIAANEKN